MKLNTVKLRLLILSIMALWVFTGCLKDYNTTVALPELGSAANVIPEEIRTEFESKMDIYEGLNPPDITCSFVMSKNTLLYSSDNYSGTSFVDHYMRFYNKNGNTYEYRAKEKTSEAHSPSVVVIGSGDSFTAYFTSERIDSEYNTRSVTANLISGTITSSGIRNIKHAFIMLEKYDPNSRLMDVNEYRIFFDADGLAEFEDWDYTKAIPGIEEDADACASDWSSKME